MIKNLNSGLTLIFQNKMYGVDPVGVYLNKIMYYIFFKTLKNQKHSQYQEKFLKSYLI